MDPSELKKAKILLAQNGFISSGKKKELEERQRRTREKDFKKFLLSLNEKAADYADVEEMEMNRLEPPVETGYPKPFGHYRFIFESPAASIEEIYFWMMSHLRFDQGFLNVVKISDIFTASEMSSLSGTLQYRLAQQQEKAAQYLRGISDMVKALFQIVREIRILNEKIRYYDDSKKAGRDGQTAEIALKGQWIDLVEQGTKNPGSVYGLAQQVGFTILPDLFFRVKVDKVDDVGKEVDKLEEFNPKIREVLKRKLYQYYTWKEKTEAELKTRRAFILKYLRQHYNTIKLYMGWIKPYLKTIRRMGQGAKSLESAEIISAFETSKIEIEILTYKQPIGDYYPVILATFNMRTTPQMSYVSEGYQKGPIHVGQVEFFMRSYVWTAEQIEGYRKYREAEDLELLKTIDETIYQTMDALGDEFKGYLESEGESFKKVEKEEKKRADSALEPFTALFSGFRDIFEGVFPGLVEVFTGEKKKREKTSHEKGKDFDSAKGAINFSMYQTYKNFKKSHNFIAW